MGNNSTKENNKKRKEERNNNNNNNKDNNNEEEEISENILEEELQRISGKLLLKNCKIWKWENDGINTSNNSSSSSSSSFSSSSSNSSHSIQRNISGKVISLPYLAIDYYGRLINITNNITNNIQINEELFETIIDCSNQVILPGLIDSHIHVMSTGESSYYLDLRNCNSIEELKTTLKNHSDNNPQLPWIIGVNWDQTNLSRYPTRYDLDEVVPSKPVFLWRCCWHIGVANSTALRKSGIDLSSVSFNIPGGEIEVNASGPTGILKESAVRIVVSAQKEKSENFKEKFIVEGLDLCLKSGLTGVQTNDEHTLEIYQDLVKSPNGLPIRVFLTPLHQEITEEDSAVKLNGPIFASNILKPFNEILNEEESNVTSPKSYLIMERLKIFTDGSLGAETAAINQISENNNNHNHDEIPILSIAVNNDDNDDNDNNNNNQQNSNSYRGILLYDTSYLTNMVSTAKSNNFRLEIHCIGDRAAEETLTALENGGCNPSDRPVMTHCQVLSPSIIQRMKNIGAIANVQPSFVPTDMRWVLQRLAPSQIDNSYCWKTLLEKGVWVAGGSDSPIESYSPFRGMYDAIYRVAIDTDPDDLTSVFRPSERLTFAESLWLYTIGAAYAGNCEKVLGKIEPGFAADLVMIDANVFNNYTLLKDLEPEVVIVGGDVKFIHPNAGLKGISVVSKGFQRDLGNSNQSSTKRQRKDVSMGGPYTPGKNGLSLGLPRANGFCACWLQGKFCQEIYSTEINHKSSLCSIKTTSSTSISSTTLSSSKTNLHS